MKDTEQTELDSLMEEGANVTRAALRRVAMRAVQQHKLFDCQRIVTWASENTECFSISGPALCAILQPKGRQKLKKYWNRTAWIELRVSTIRTLRIIDDRFAAPTLAYVLLSDVEEVRTEAAAALKDLGNQGALAIVNEIKLSREWDRDGMMAAIYTVGAIGDNCSGPTLVRILFGQMPNYANRWGALQRKWAAMLGTIASAICALICMANFPTIDFTAFVLCVAFSFGAVGLGSLLPIGFVVNRKANNELEEIKACCATPLMQIQDTGCIPSLIEVATEKYSSSSRIASETALRHLLPLLKTEEVGIYAGSTERRLGTLMHLHDSRISKQALLALEVVGTGQSAETVERFIRRRPLQYRTDDYNMIRSIAERILPVLQERKSKEEAHSVLLRASENTHASAATLLRAANSASDVPAEQLLRPGTLE